MSAEDPGTRTIKTDYLARVEGEGAMSVRIRDKEVEEVRLEIYEPPRFFEAFLRGRSFTEAPDITARICGICPVAYMTSAFNAIEDALGVEVPDGIRLLRRLMYCGEWIESHALHVFLLHAPDFLGFESAWAMARDHREVVEGGLKIKAMGNELLRTVGGRAIHPINVRVGGFYKAPTRRDLEGLRPGLEEARELARVSVRLGLEARLPRLRAGLRVRRPLGSRHLRDRGRPPDLLRRPRHRPRRVRRALHRVPHRALDRASLAPQRRGHLLPRADGPLRARLREALANRPRGRRAGGARRRSAATPSRASSSARWRSSTPSTRRFA